MKTNAAFAAEEGGSEGDYKTNHGRAEVTKMTNTRLVLWGGENKGRSSQGNQIS